MAAIFLKIRIDQWYSRILVKTQFKNKN